MTAPSGSDTVGAGMRAPDGIIVVLGSPNSDAGELSSIARERCRLALRLHRRHPRFAILPTGGFGPHFNPTTRPHGAYLAEELVRLGVPATRLLAPIESSNTVEDATLSRPVIEALGPRRVLVVTSDYHVARARFVFARVFDLDLEWHATRTDVTGCTEDLDALRAHERRALMQLETRGLRVPGKSTRPVASSSIAD